MILHCLQDVAVEPGNVHCFWSAGEDGRVHEYDARLRPSSEAASMLVKAPTSASGFPVEFKSLDINKVQL